MQRRSMMDPPKHLLKQIGPLALLLFGACHQTRIVPLPEPRNGQTRTDVAGHSKSYVLGYFEGAPFRADCRDGVESIRISMGVLDTVIQVLAGGLFSTRSVEVRCLVPHLDVAALERGQPVRLPGVHFEPNASRLQSDSLIVLDELAAYLSGHPAMMIRLSSHTDLSVAYPLNETLSLSRAAAVKDYLVGKGIGEARILIEGRGSQSPIVWATDEVSSYINNRLEAFVWNGASALFLPVQRPAETPTPLAVGEAEITMLDGSLLRGRIINQTGDRVQAIINGQSMVILKEKIKLIQYGR